MTSAKEIFDNSMDRAKRLRVFEVTRYVDEGWLPNGYVPFDMHVTGNTATISVYATSAEEADEMVREFMEDQ